MDEIADRPTPSWISFLPDDMDNRRRLAGPCVPAAKWLAVVGAAGLIALGGWRAVRLAASGLTSTFTVTLPASPEIDLCRVFFDDTPTAITVSAGWEHVPRIVPAWRLRSDRTLWLDMDLDDWNTVPTRLREAALARMLEAYAEQIQGPAVWTAMTANKWDLVPPPVRVVAILRMIDGWVARTPASATYGVSRRRLSETVAAIVMVESWFNHRAVNVNTGGDVDLGLAQASASCRASLGRLYREGVIDFKLSDEDYFDPWEGSRVATFWLVRTLAEADGDLDLAIRAYHRGIANARRGEGRQYLRDVVVKRQRFIRNGGAPPAWRWVIQRVYPPSRMVLATPFATPSVDAATASSRALGESASR